MRSMARVLALVLALGVSAVAGDMVRVPLLNGVYSVEAPPDWNVNQEEDGSGVVFTPDDSDTAWVFITAPNFDVEDHEEYAGLYMGANFKKLGGGEITGEEAGEMGGYPCTYFTFTIPAKGTSIEGRAGVVDIDGAVVMFLVMATADRIEAFLPAGGAVVDSYQIDPEAVNNNTELLAELSQKMNAELAEAAGE